MAEPKRLDRNQARKLVSRLLSAGTLSFTSHATKALADDDMTSVDAVNVLRGGKILEEGELVNGSVRYRVHTSKFVVVVVIDEGPAIVRVVTAES